MRQLWHLTAPPFVACENDIAVAGGQLARMADAVVLVRCYQRRPTPGEWVAYDVALVTLALCNVAFDGGFAACQSFPSFDGDVAILRTDIYAVGLSAELLSCNQRTA